MNKQLTRSEYLEHLVKVNKFSETEAQQIITALDKKGTWQKKKPTKQ